MQNKKKLLFSATKKTWTSGAKVQKTSEDMCVVNSSSKHLCVVKCSSKDISTSPCAKIMKSSSLQVKTSTKAQC